MFAQASEQLEEGKRSLEWKIQKENVGIKDELLAWIGEGGIFMGRWGRDY